jgi:hypothetical protein
MMIFKCLLLVITIAFLSACGSTPPDQSARIKVCSNEANAKTPSTRLGNSAYWNCLSREEKSQNLAKEQIRLTAELENLRKRCDILGFKKDTVEYSQCLLSLQQQSTQNMLRAAEESERRRRQMNRDIDEIFKTKPTLTCTSQPGSMTSFCR